MPYIGELLAPQAGAVGIWHFNGNSTDSSGNGNNGTDTSITYSLANGKFGQGAGFGGTSHIVLGAIGTLTTYTVVGWAKMTTNPVTQRCIHDQYIAINSSKLLGILNGAGYTTGATVWQTDVWYHFAIVRSGATAYIYLNGSLDGTGGVTTSLASSQWLGGRADVGDNANYSWLGAIDEYAIFNVAKDANWVRKQYAWSKGKYL